MRVGRCRLGASHLHRQRATRSAAAPGPGRMGPVTRPPYQADLIRRSSSQPQAGPARRCRAATRTRGLVFLSTEPESRPHRGPNLVPAICRSDTDPLAASLGRRSSWSPRGVAVVAEDCNNFFGFGGNSAPQLSVGGGRRCPKKPIPIPTDAYSRLRGTVLYYRDDLLYISSSLRSRTKIGQAGSQICGRIIPRMHMCRRFLDRKHIERAQQNSVVGSAEAEQRESWRKLDAMNMDGIEAAIVCAGELSLSEVAFWMEMDTQLGSEDSSSCCIGPFEPDTPSEKETKSKSGLINSSKHIRQNTSRKKQETCEPKKALINLSLTDFEDLSIYLEDYREFLRYGLENKSSPMYCDQPGCTPIAGLITTYKPSVCI